jgi:hypothetical protein
MKIHSIGSQTNHYVIWFGVYHNSEAVLRLEEFGLSFVVIVERNMRELNRYRYCQGESSSLQQQSLLSHLQSNGSCKHNLQITTPQPVQVLFLTIQPQCLQLPM